MAVVTAEPRSLRLFALQGGAGPECILGTKRLRDSPWMTGLTALHEKLGFGAWVEVVIACYSRTLALVGRTFAGLSSV